MTDKARTFYLELLEKFGGDRERLALFLARTVRVGSIKVCRRVISEALGEI